NQGAPLARDITFFLGILPPTHSYNAQLFSASGLVNLLRDTPVPDYRIGAGEDLTARPCSRSFINMLVDWSMEKAVFTGAILIESVVYKDPAGGKIFDRGAKLFPEDEGFMLEYIKYLHLKDDTTNARVVFETCVNRLTQKPEKKHRAKMLYRYFHKYEAQFGELSSVAGLERRMAELWPEDPKLSHFTERYSVDSFDPIAYRLIISPAVQLRPNLIMPSIEQATSVRDATPLPVAPPVPVPVPAPAPTTVRQTASPAPQYLASAHALGDLKPFVELPVLEPMIVEANALEVPTHLLATLEVFYHAVIILSCRLPRPGAESHQSSYASSIPPAMANARRSLASERIAHAVKKEKLSPVPFIPYAVSLSLSVEYRKMRHSALPMFRARSRDAFKSSCELLKRFKNIFYSAKVTYGLGERMLKEMERAATTLVQEAPAAANASEISSEPTPEVAFSADPQDFDMSMNGMPNLDSIDFNMDVFGHFDPSFDLTMADNALEGNLDIGLPLNWGEWAQFGS
ncbi:hypothetical protein BN1723_011960, partial [Verticillium longisporum]